VNDNIQATKDIYRRYIAGDGKRKMGFFILVGESAIDV